MLFSFLKTDRRRGGYLPTAGDVCFAECKRPNGRIIVIGAIRISPNTSIKNIIQFLQYCFYSFNRCSLIWPYMWIRTRHRRRQVIHDSIRGLQMLGLSSKSLGPLKDFLRYKFNLFLNNSPTIPKP